MGLHFHQHYFGTRPDQQALVIRHLTDKKYLRELETSLSYCLYHSTLKFMSLSGLKSFGDSSTQSSLFFLQVDSFSAYVVCGTRHIIVWGMKNSPQTARQRHNVIGSLNSGQIVRSIFHKLCVPHSFCKLYIYFVARRSPCADGAESGPFSTSAAIWDTSAGSAALKILVCLFAFGATYAKSSNRYESERHRVPDPPSCVCKNIVTFVCAWRYDPVCCADILNDNLKCQPYGGWWQS